MSKEITREDLVKLERMTPEGIIRFLASTGGLEFHPEDPIRNCGSAFDARDRRWLQRRLEFAKTALGEKAIRLAICEWKRTGLMPHKFKMEFPDYALEEMPEAVIEGVNAGWLEDTSWHNETTPTFEANGLRLWTDYKDKKLREPGENTPRFMLSKASDRENGPIMEFEDEAGLAEALKRMKEIKPEPYWTMDIYKHKGESFSNGGISERYDEVRIWPHFDKDAPENAVVIVEDEVLKNEVRIRAVPANREGEWDMSGGCYIHTSNGAAPHYGKAIPLFDRYE